MTTVEVLAKLTVDDLVVAVEKLPTRELTGFVRRVIAIQARRGVPLLVDEEEKTLLEAVQGRPLAGDAQGRLDRLREKSREGTLTPEEQAKLLGFVQQVDGKPKTVLPLIQWLRLLPPVVAALALTTLEGVVK